MPLWNLNFLLGIAQDSSVSHVMLEISTGDWGLYLGFTDWECCLDLL